MNVGIDIGASKTLLVTFDAKNKIVGERKFKTTHNQILYLQQLEQELREILADKQAPGLVVGVPGSVDTKRLTFIRGGVVPWQNLHFGTVLRKFSKHIIMENDAKLAGLAEATNGSGQGYQLVLYVTISSGIGSAIIKNGQLVGEGSEAGQMFIGKKEGQRLEDLVAGPAIKERFHKDGSELSDPKAWKVYADDLAVGLYNLIAAVEPDVLVLGGGVSVHFKKFIKPLRTALGKLNNDIYPLPPIKQARFVETAVIEGCRQILTINNKS